MKTLTAGFITAIEKQITNPGYAISLDMNSQMIRGCTRGPVTVDGDSYSYDQIAAVRVDNNQMAVTIGADGTDFVTLAFGQSIQKREALCYLYYEGEYYLRWTGLIDYPEKIPGAPFVTIHCKTIYGLRAAYPDFKMRPPTFNFMPEIGTKVQVGETDLEVQPVMYRRYGSMSALQTRRT